jgi:addiction module HigA family antidote
MKAPPHPGEVIRELCLDPLGLSVTKAAAQLGVTRKALSEFLNGHSGILPEIAIRLPKIQSGVGKILSPLAGMTHPYSPPAAYFFSAS